MKNNLQHSDKFMYSSNWHFSVKKEIILLILPSQKKKELVTTLYAFNLHQFVDTCKVSKTKQKQNKNPTVVIDQDSVI